MVYCRQWTQGFVVDRDFARQSSLQTTGNATTREGGSDASQAGIVHDVQISLRGFELTHRNLVVIELKSIEPAIGHQVDGIIGSRLFDDLVVVVDYQHPCLSVYTPQQYRPSGKEIVLPARVDQPFFQYIDASIALPGTKPVSGSSLIDGGANYYANLYKRFSDAHKLPASSMKLLHEPWNRPTARWPGRAYRRRALLGQGSSHYLRARCGRSHGLQAITPD